ncbi:MAG: hypothetical protein LJE67_01835 [Salaquimonas sp.]|jgi:hypothetical protein|nr:hypothetical protein [Salaquimonas sp.]
MQVSETTGLSDSDREIVALLESALERLRIVSPARKRVRGHVEAALTCYRDKRESIPPSELNSANDG